MPRIALFSDSCDEANGVKRTTLAIETSAKRRGIPVLSVHPCSETRLVHDGSIARLGLKRSSVFSFGIAHDQRFDLSMRRYITRVAETVEWFAPDVLHFIGASDVALLGASVGRRLNIPMVASWHDSLHWRARRRGVRLLHAVEADIDVEGLDGWDRIFVDICHMYDTAIAEAPVDAGPAQGNEKSQRIGRPAPGRI
jgi:hypothetical protein